MKPLRSRSTGILVAVTLCAAMLAFLSRVPTSAAQALDPTAAAEAQRLENAAAAARQKATTLLNSAKSWEENLIKNNREKAANASDAKTRTTYEELARKQEDGVRKMRADADALTRGADDDAARAARIRQGEPVEAASPANRAVTGNADGAIPRSAPAAPAGGQAGAPDPITSDEAKELTRLDSQASQVRGQVRDTLSKLRADLLALNKDAGRQISAAKFVSSGTAPEPVPHVAGTYWAELDQSSNGPDCGVIHQRKSFGVDADAVTRWTDQTTGKFDKIASDVETSYSAWRKQRDDIRKKLEDNGRADIKRKQELQQSSKTPLRPEQYSWFMADRSRQSNLRWLAEQEKSFNNTAYRALDSALLLLWQAHKDVTHAGIPIANAAGDVAYKISLADVLSQTSLVALYPLYFSLFETRCRPHAPEEQSAFEHAVDAAMTKCSSAEQQQRDLFAVRFRELGDRYRQTHADLMKLRATWKNYFSGKDIDLDRDENSRTNISRSYEENVTRNLEFASFKADVPNACSRVDRFYYVKVWVKVPVKYPDIESEAFEFTYPPVGPETKVAQGGRLPVDGP